jgi:hypothetical protein
LPGRDIDVQSREGGRKISMEIGSTDRETMKWVEKGEAREMEGKQDRDEERARKREGNLGEKEKGRESEMEKETGRERESERESEREREMERERERGRVEVESGRKDANHLPSEIGGSQRYHKSELDRMI